MSKNINFERSKNDYILKFQEKISKLPWPPNNEVLPYVKNYLWEVIEDEIKDLFTSQLKAKETSINSAAINKIISDTIWGPPEQLKTQEEYYTNISDKIFTQIEENITNLLGQEDICGWFNI